MTLATSRPHATLQRADSLGALSAIEPAWRELAQRSPDATVFSSWPWNAVSARHLAPGCRPSVLLLQDEGPLALLPLARRRAQTLRALVWLGSGGLDYSRADYQDWLCLPGAEDAALEAFATALAHDSSWDMLWLQELPATSRLVLGLPEVAGAHGWHLELRPHDEAFYIDLPSTWEAYAETLSANTRGAIGRKTRKLLREAGARFEEIDAAGLPPAMESLFALHTRRWQSAGRPGIFKDEASRAFHRELAAALEADGMLDLMLLQAGAEVIGARYSFRFGGVHSFYASGFAPEEHWAPHSLGLVMDGEGVRRAIQHGDRREDLLRGDGAYKQRYAPQRGVNLDVKLFRTHAAYVRQRAYRSLRRLVGRAVHMARKEQQAPSPDFGDRP